MRGVAEDGARARSPSAATLSRRLLGGGRHPCARGLGAVWLVATPASAKALEASLLAPCCYGGTVDVHDSQIARDLRVEIETRVARGEATPAIQADMVARYGDRALAMRKSGAFVAVVEAAMIGILGAGIWLFFLMRRWTASPEITPSSPAALGPTGARNANDERLDAELRDLDFQ